MRPEHDQKKTVNRVELLLLCQLLLPQDKTQIILRVECEKDTTQTDPHFCWRHVNWIFSWFSGWQSLCSPPMPVAAQDSGLSPLLSSHSLNNTPSVRTSTRGTKLQSLNCWFPTTTVLKVTIELALNNRNWVSTWQAKPIWARNVLFEMPYPVSSLLKWKYYLWFWQISIILSCPENIDRATQWCFYIVYPDHCPKPNSVSFDDNGLSYSYMNIWYAQRTHFL